MLPFNSVLKTFTFFFPNFLASTTLVIPFHFIQFSASFSLISVHPLLPLHTHSFSVFPFSYIHSLYWFYFLCFLHLLFTPSQSQFSLHNKIVRHPPQKNEINIIVIFRYNYNHNIYIYYWQIIEIINQKNLGTYYIPCSVWVTKHSKQLVKYNNRKCKKIIINLILGSRYMS